MAASWRHVGYIMLLYLAGLKGVDPSLREAAKVDGATERTTFFKVVFPVMAPINIIVLVVTVIESLRAFDLVWVINKGRNGLELISTLVTSNIVGEASRIGFGSALATFMLAHLHASSSPSTCASHEGAAMTDRRRPAPGHRRPTPLKRTKEGRPQQIGGQGGRRAIQVFLAVIALIWIFPVGYALLDSFRDYAYTAKNGYLSFGGFTLDNYKNAWEQADFSRTLLNSAYITVPAVLLTLFLSCCVAFVVARFSFKFNLVAARRLHGRQPAAAAGPAHPGLPDVPRHRGAVLVQRVGHPAQQLLGPHRSSTSPSRPGSARSSCPTT